MINTLIYTIKNDFRIKAGYGIAFVLLLVSYILTLIANSQVQEQSNLVNHTNKLIQSTESLMSYMKDGELGSRGFALMRDERFLEPFKKSGPGVDSTFDYLKKETKDNGPQQVKLYTLKRLLDTKFMMMNSGILYLSKHNFEMTDSMKQLGYRSKQVMDSIRFITNDIKTTEQSILDSRLKDLQSKYIALNFIIVSSLILAFVFAIFGLITYLREKKARLQADEQVKDYQAQLEKRIAQLDVANKELKEMRLSEKFAATGRIARSIAHEVRNPLTNIDLATGQIRSELGEGDENTNMLFDMINRNSKRINQLITELLSATRFADLNYQPTSLNNLAADALALANDRLQLKQIKVVTQFDEQLPIIAADKEKLGIALLNIIVNASEAIESADGELSIQTSTENGLAVISIADNGIGMDPEALSKLFEPYFTTKSKGNGLGLTNTQNIILNHKGTIQVDSEQGKGTTFILRFKPVDH